MIHPFQINFLDHVAILVKDVEKSAQWYERVLGMKRADTPLWNNNPLFMVIGKAAIAIFPIHEASDGRQPPNVRIDHFAFNVDKENFLKAQEHYRHLGIPFRFSDHTYSLSIYTHDPDGHEVELTTLVMQEEKFYK